MTGPSSPQQAWPFLVARGRHHGYRTLLAPDFLLAERDYGVLDDSVTPSAVDDQAQVMPVVTRAGRPLTVVHATHRVTAADIAEPGAAPPDQPPRDEYGRPLQLMYGFVCVDGGGGEPHTDDVNGSRETALRVYRRFLADEEGFTVEPGRAFPLRSADTRQPYPRRPDYEPTSAPRPLPSRTTWPIRAAILVIVGILFLVLAKGCGCGPFREDEDADPDCTSVSVVEPTCRPFVEAPR
ncbi:hypothetical protein ACIGBH_03120 [Streptomyces sp. NPDC085929]|uniref:hypothetical protein n=1 Tax=Streptomyces sp. NPDC085929 TaxID=3365739 RepID=UPI0037D18440